jgi:FkbM family methyltransferase
MTNPANAAGSFLETCNRLLKLLQYIATGRKERRYFQFRSRFMHWLAARGFYDSEHLNFLRKHLQPGQSVADVGANFGVYTEVMARCVGPSGRVLSFEPIGFIYDTLKKKFEKTPQVSLFNCGLSNQAVREASLRVPLLFGRVPEPALGTLESTSLKYRNETIKVITFDSLIDTMSDLFFVKVDIEGHEKQFLEGALETIRRFRPLVQFEDNHLPDSIEFYNNFCAENSYQLAYLKGGKLLRLSSEVTPPGINFYLAPAESPLLAS